jgi:hypothetical protein
VVEEKIEQNMEKVSSDFDKKRNPLANNLFGRKNGRKNP